MLFNSLEFWIFFSIVIVVCYSCSHRWQNLFLVLASYVFYAAWDWRFLGLIAVSTLVAFLAAIKIEDLEDQTHKRRFLWGAVGFQLACLGFFKYFNFFVDSFAQLFSLQIQDGSWFALQVLLPVGISFFTFQTISYIVDVHRGDVKATRNGIDLALYVAFFPQLVAGPIERGSRFLPQILRPRRISLKRIDQGITLITWGLFKKVCIADVVAGPVNTVFASPDPTPLAVYAAVVLFAIQIYCDFSGYTDIARGVAKLLGFELMINFNLPYFATNPSDFWRRWHISLSTWLRDYLYVPLGGSRFGQLLTYRNLMITMVLGGLWHGASYNFLLWGVYHGAILGIHRAISTPSAGNSPSGTTVMLKILGMFHLTLIGWLLFRVESMDQLQVLLGSFSGDWTVWAPAYAMMAFALPFMLPLVLLELYQYAVGRLDVTTGLHWSIKFAIWSGLLWCVLAFASSTRAEFIYFQF